jgi:predicted urease superfamily metal-dependent hydrolase
MTEICLNYIHFTQSEKAIENFKKARGKSIISINRFTGNLEKEFNSLSDAAKFYNLTTSNISKVCKHTLNYLKDWVFLYKEEYNPIKNYKTEH